MRLTLSPGRWVHLPLGPLGPHGPTWLAQPPSIYNEPNSSYNVLAILPKLVVIQFKSRRVIWVYVHESWVQ